MDLEHYSLILHTRYVVRVGPNSLALAWYHIRSDDHASQDQRFVCQYLHDVADHDESYSVPLSL